MWIPKRCKGVHCVDLGESFQTHIFLQNSASIQPRTSPLKFAASRVEVASSNASRDVAWHCADQGFCRVRPRGREKNNSGSQLALPIFSREIWQIVGRFADLRQLSKIVLTVLSTFVLRAVVSAFGNANLRFAPQRNDSSSSEVRISPRPSAIVRCNRLFSHMRTCNLFSFPRSLSLC